jgi:uncharacterized protein
MLILRGMTFGVAAATFLWWMPMNAFAQQKPELEREIALQTDNVSTMKNLYQAIAEKNIPAAMGLLDPAVVFDAPEGQPHVGGMHSGRETAAKAVWGRLALDWDPIAAEVADITALADGRGLAIGRYRGTLKANGNKLDADFAHLWTIRDGKAVHLKVFTDTALWTKAWLGP